MFKNLAKLLLLMILMGGSSIAQNPSSANKPHNAPSPTGVIRGTVIDAETNLPIPYVNIAILRNTKDSTLVNGITTDNNGSFSIKQAYGDYLIRYSFIGYETQASKLKVNKNNHNLGVIRFEKAAEMLESVEISAERSMMEYQLDKRVVNVDKNIVSAGGDATDVLENVPSVSVDQEGNVSLRGSGSVTVLVDGRPSELLGSDLQTVLEQIPAATIESIEVITNPSAKYNPEGMSGIINIVLKEKVDRGFNGSATISAGAGINNQLDIDKFLFPQSSLNLSLNYSNKKFATFFSGDIRYFQTTSNSFNDKTMINMNNIHLLQDRSSTGDRLGRGFKLGGDWYINDKNTLGLSYNLRRGGTPWWSDGNNERLYSWQVGDEDNPMNPNNYYGLEDSYRKMLFQNINLNYEKKFQNPGQVLNLDANLNFGNFSNDKTQIRRRVDEFGDENFYLGNTSASNNKRAYVKLDYIHPFSKNLKLETGYNLNYVNTNAEYDYFPSRDLIRDDSMSYIFKYEESVHAIYGTLGYGLSEKLSAQLGLRLEQVFREGSKDQNNELLTFPKDEKTKDYFSVYPTLHVSYNFSDSQSGQVSYSRRIRRPSPWSLSPFIDVNNPEFIRFGNPDILPEYTDAFELGYSKIYEMTTIFTSLYYRHTNNSMTHFNFLWNEENARKYGFDWVWEVAGEGFSDSIRVANTSLNISQSSNYGAELILDQRFSKNWRANLSGNLYGIYEDGREFGGRLVNTLSWDLKLNTTITLPKSFVLQISGQYRPKVQTIQGHRDQMYWVDLSVKKDVLNKKGSFSLRFSDVFNTRQRSSYSFTENYEQYSTYHRTSQYLVFSFNYRFGTTDKKQMERERRRRMSEQGGGDDMNGMEE